MLFKTSHLLKNELKRTWNGRCHVDYLIENKVENRIAGSLASAFYVRKRLECGFEPAALSDDPPTGSAHEPETEGLRSARDSRGYGKLDLVF